MAIESKMKKLMKAFQFSVIINGMVREIQNTG